MPGFDCVRFEVYDPGDALIVGIDSGSLGDGDTYGATAEDRFFGLRHDAGISRSSIAMSASNDFEVDHLQSGSAVVPLPASLPAMVVAPLALASRRRTARARIWSRYAGLPGPRNRVREAF